jgi:hypothetical protein
LLGILCGSIDIVLICFPVREEKRREEETRRREEETRRREEEHSGGGEPRRLQSRLCVCVCERERERYDNRKQLNRQKRTAATTSCIYVWRTCGSLRLPILLVIISFPWTFLQSHGIFFAATQREELLVLVL